MTYNIIFSTYINKTKTYTPQKQLEDYLVALAKVNNIQGFSLANQLGYWAGELEQSHVLTLLDTHKQVAYLVAEQIKKHFEQDAVILKPVTEHVYFI